MIQDIIFLSHWYLQLLLLGFIFLPITFLLFENLKDRGYIFSKIVATLLISYSVFFLATTKLLPFTKTTIIITVLVFLLINVLLIKKIQLIKIIKKSWKFFFLEELFFILCLIFWTFIKSHEPSLQTLEKFMDFGFINSAVRANYLPAPDMWFAQFSINYYYFGHFIVALLTKLSSIPSYITYNLMLITIFAYTVTLTFSITLTLFSKKEIPKMKEAVVGILTAGLVAFSGNLHTVYAFFSSYQQKDPLPITNLIFSPFTFPNNYWYPNATRFIPFTIHEFPLYSFVVSDLHGHVSDIPFILFGIAIILEIFVSKKIKRLSLIMLSLSLTVMYMTNTWDAPIYGLLVSLVIFIKYFYVLKNITRTVQKSLLPIIIVILFTVLFSIPFSASFKPFVSGIGIMCAPDFLIEIGKIGPFLFEANHCQQSPLWQLTILYGFFYFFASVLIVLFIKQWRKKKIVAQDIFVLALIVVSTILIILPEFLYVKDIYPEHYRANTMFKLTYEAFIMLSIVAGYTIMKITTGKKNFLLFGATFILLLLVFLYPFFAIRSYYANLKTYSGLNGISYLKVLHPEDYSAILFINKNISNQPIILEAQGDSYTDYGRISANTGLPTILGWTVHEWLWRGSYSVVAPRIADIKTLYETSDLALTKKLLKKYNVSYVYIGDLERQKYENLQEKKFDQLGKIIFEEKETKIYQLFNN
jgi:YYY domain-containing protein